MKLLTFTRPSLTLFSIFFRLGGIRQCRLDLTLSLNKEQYPQSIACMMVMPQFGSSLELQAKFKEMLTQFKKDLVNEIINDKKRIEDNLEAQLRPDGPITKTLYGKIKSLLNAKSLQGT
jgi:hypothetical protein